MDRIHRCPSKQLNDGCGFTRNCVAKHLADFSGVGGNLSGLDDTVQVYVLDRGSVKETRVASGFREPLSFDLFAMLKDQGKVLAFAHDDSTARARF